MDESARIGKNNAIKEHGKETCARHASMRPFCIELKLDLKCLSKAEQEKLWHYFTQCRWLCNYLLSLPEPDFRSFDTKTRIITSLDKDGNSVEHCLEMPAKFIQSVYSSLNQDMASLAAKGDGQGSLSSGQAMIPLTSTSMGTRTGSAMAIRMGSTGILST